MVALFANPEVPIDQFLQYGSFGLVAFLVFMFVFSIYPKMQKQSQDERDSARADFSKALDKVVNQSKLDSDRCQENTIKDRELRYEFKEILSRLAEKIG